MTRAVTSCAWAALALLAPSPAEAAPADTLLISADHVHTAAGDPIEDGQVLVEGGAIREVGQGLGGSPQLEVGAVTPGLIDLGARVVTSWRAVEQSTETPLDLRVADALDLYDEGWDRELRSGVTCVLATPPDRAVLGGPCVLIKTGGERDVAARTVAADACLRGSMGTEPSEGNSFARGGRPSSFYVRRPTTRMAVEWGFRKAFYDALAARRDPARAFPGSDHLLAVLDGELPLSVQAWATQDIRTAVFLKEEFGIPRMFVDAAAEAWKEPELLVRSGIGVVLPPHDWEGRTGRDNAFLAWNTAARLHELGVPFALSGHGARAADARLAVQPALAMRGGLPSSAALEAVTLAPARMLGVEDRIGSIEVGKDADLVLWSGEPFLPTSRVVGVVLDGRLVVDPRNEG